MKKQKLIYLASPYSHLCSIIEQIRRDDVTKAAAKLTKKLGYAMFLPITQSFEMCKYETSLKSNFEQWKSIDLFMVGKKCDELWVLMLYGWDKSVGVRAEIECAKKNKVPIKYIRYIRNEERCTLKFVKLKKEVIT